MRGGHRRLSSLALGLALLTAGLVPVLAQDSPTPPPPVPVATPGAMPLVTVAQPSFDVLRLEHNGAVVPYNVWFDWLPVLQTTPDGGAWVFFSAQAKLPTSTGPRRLYASRFDPALQVWLPAQALPGGDLQFGPAAAVDGQGVVHVVYSSRADASEITTSTLLYTSIAPGGAWTEPVPVAPDPNAGHQMMPSLAVTSDDVLHLIWRDQRALAPELRAAMPANADLYASDFVNGAWSAPVPLNTRLEPDLNAGWPHLVVDGDRLVAAWSVYKGTTPEEMLTAVRVDWSTRPTSDAAWGTPATLLTPDAQSVGGRQLDLKTDPTGGVMLLFSRYSPTSLDQYVQRLPAGGDAWSEPLLLSSGDFGYLASLSLAPDGTAFVVFNAGRDRAVKIGAVMVAPGMAGPAPIQILTPGESGLQVRAASDTTADGKLWIAYFYGEQGSNVATEVRTLRGANTE